MPSSIHHTFVDLVYTYPFPAAVIAIICGLTTSLYLVSEILKPVGKRNTSSGRKPRLPPGPRGVPIFGSLLDLKSTRDDPHNVLVGTVDIPVA